MGKAKEVLTWAEFVTEVHNKLIISPRSLYDQLKSRQESGAKVAVIYRNHDLGSPATGSIKVGISNIFLLGSQYGGMPSQAAYLAESFVPLEEMSEPQDHVWPELLSERDQTSRSNRARRARQTFFDAVTAACEAAWPGLYKPL